MKQKGSHLQETGELAVTIRDTGKPCVECIHHLGGDERKGQSHRKRPIFERLRGDTVSQPAIKTTTDLAEYKEGRVYGAALFDALPFVAGFAIVLRAGKVNEMELADACLEACIASLLGNFVYLGCEEERRVRGHASMQHFRHAFCRPSCVVSVSL
jgi:hypothetical protein